MNPPSGKPIDHRLAVYHERLLAKESQKDLEADPDLAGAAACLRLIERVRRQAPSPDGWFTSSENGSSAVERQCEPVPDRRAEAPDQIGRFRIVRRLGEGGFGIVFEAVDPDLNRAVALKVPRPEALLSETWRSRFLREAEAAALLNHPHLVPVYEVGHAGSLCYIVQAYCGGISLDRWLQERPGPIAPTAAARLIRTVAEAVHHAHSRGVLHRDIKPSNILLEGRDKDTPQAPPASGDTVSFQANETVEATASTGVSKRAPQAGGTAAIAPDELADVARLSDFGLARVMDDVSDQTRSGAVVGTPAYMAPEQAEGRPRDVGIASDVYSLGAVLYELLTGRPPFSGGSLLAVLQAVREKDPPPPRLHQPEIPLDLEAICLKCLEKDPQRRYASSAALAEDLGRFMHGEPVAARRSTWWQRTARWCRRHPASALLAGVVVLLTLGLVGGSVTAAVLLSQARQDTLETLEKAILARDRATRSEDLAVRALYEARVAQSQAGRRSGKLGQRLDSRDALKKAAGHVPRLGLDEASKLLLRNELIAGSGLVDLRLDRTLSIPRHRELAIEADSHVERFVYLSKARELLIRGLSDADPVRRLELPQGDFSLITDLSVCSESGCTAARFRDIGTSLLAIWTKDSDRPAATIDVFTGMARPYDFSADGQRLAFVAPDGNVALYSVPDLREVRRFTSKQAAWTVRFDPQGARLAIARTGNVEVVNTASGSLLRSLTCEPYVHELAWTSDGRVLGAGCADHRAWIWDAGTGVLQTTLEGHTGRVIRIAFHPQRPIVATSSEDKTLRLWDADNGEPLLRTEAELSGISRDGRWLAAGDRRYELVIPEQHRFIRIPSAPGSRWSRIDRLSVERTGRLAAASNASQLTLLDLNRGEVVACLPVAEGTAEFDRGGRWLLIASRTGLCRFPVSVETADERTVITVGERVLLTETDARGLVSSSSAGDLIAVADRYYRAQLLVHDVARRTTRVLRPEHPGAKWLDLSADGRYLATGPWDGSHVQVWNTRTGKLVWELPAVHARVRFSPDGRMLAVDEGGRYGVWNTANWQPLFPKRERSLEAFPAPLAWSPDGRMLATLNSRRQVCLLETGSFTELATLALDEQQVIESLTFAPDQSRLLAGTHHPGIVHVWDLKAIRTDLRAMGLDWQPEFESNSTLSRSTTPVRLRHDLDELAPQSGTSRANRLKRIGELTRVIASAPNDSSPYWHRASTYLRLGQAEEARVDATRATQLAPQSHHGWFWKGRALQMLGRCAEALEAFEKSLALHPRDAWCCRHLASLLTEGPPEVRDAERGLQLAETALDLVGGSSSSSEAVPVFLNTLAMAHYRRGDGEKALDALDRAGALHQDRPSSTTLLRQALCYQKLGHAAQARRCYDEALDQVRLDRYDAQFNFDTLREEAAAAIGVE